MLQTVYKCLLFKYTPGISLMNHTLVDGVFSWELSIWFATYGNPSTWMHILSYSCFPCPFKPCWHTCPVFHCLYRFKPLQKVDGMSDSLCGSSQHCNSTPEQSVAAQSQHHQQYIGEGKTWSASTTTAVTLKSEEWFKFLSLLFLSAVIKSQWNHIWPPNTL